MAKTDGGVTVTAGTSFGYTLTVTKQGAGPAKADATVTDTLPGDLTWIGTPSGAGANCSVSNGNKTVTCTVTAAQLNTGSAVIVGQVSAPPSMASGTYTNTAVVDSPEDPAGQPGPYSVDNTATDTTPVVRQSTVDVVKVDSLIPGGFTVPGATYQYTMTVTNPSGPSTATGVTIEDPLPAGITLAATPTGVNWLCQANTVSCTYTVPLAVGATTEPLTVVVVVSPAITADTTVVNTAVATCVETAFAPCTDSSTETTPIQVPILPPTGSDPARGVVIGLGLFGLGWLLVAVARRRRAANA
jgi:uncharacterized repeat protein (TIGR01451 family)